MSISRESLLHYIWKQKLIPHGQLITTRGEAITILSEGSHNFDAGPDFSHAIIKIGCTTWAGQVELHIRSSDWLKHRHQYDPAYHSVVLHVVWEHDTDIYTGQEPIPTLELSKLINSEQVIRYEQFMNHSATLPCRPWLNEIPRHILVHWAERLAAERLERKAKHIKSLFTHLNHHAEHTLLAVTAGAYGLKPNHEALLSLLKEIPWPVLQKCRHDILSFEALLFGMAGLLTGRPTDNYQQQLKEEFAYLCRKFPNLKGFPAIPIKFGRMRPVASPVLRIAQFCAVALQYPRLLQCLLDVSDAEDAIALFSVDPSLYWKHHHRFGRHSTTAYGAPGKVFYDLLVINALAPYLFFYGNYTGRADLQQKALRWLGQTAPENNKITRAWGKDGLTASSAFESQAMIELSSSYCNTRQCSRCAIGRQVLERHIP